MENNDFDRDEFVMGAIEFRLNSLKEALAVVENKNLESVADDFRSRIDELETLKYYLLDM